MRRPGIEPGSTAWKATMLTITPTTLMLKFKKNGYSKRFMSVFYFDVHGSILKNDL